MPPMTELDAAWIRFSNAAAAAGRRRIETLFAAEPDRLQRLTFEAAGLHLDFSKQPWDAAALDAALELARAAEVEAGRDQLFAGEAVNGSEQRAALHPALRGPKGARFAALGQDVSAEVEASRERLRAFAEGIGDGGVKASSGAPFKTVVHIGIGGSDLGPRLVWDALKPLQAPIDLRFVANVDGAEIAAALAGLDPGRTLVVIVSKTFTTQETMTNARTARAWLAASLGEAAVGDHLVAVSTALAETSAFGVRDDRVFGFWDWVGGRYSLWSAVGLSCAIGLGWKAFEALLDGASQMDAHFRSAPLAANGPVMLALSQVLNRNGLGRGVRAVVPYAERLRRFPAYLQQLEMESNGKHVGVEGRRVSHATAPVVFGDVGANSQHAFFQALHQGTDIIPVDFIAVADGEGPSGHQAMLLANCLAQAEALMTGRRDDRLPAERQFDGDRPSNLILIETLDARSLGALLALYEHKTFVEGVLWRINSFDQWGVELGKTLAARILGELEGGPPLPHDPSTADLIRRLKA